MGGLYSQSLEMLFKKPAGVYNIVRNTESCSVAFIVHTSVCSKTWQFPGNVQITDLEREGVYLLTLINKQDFFFCCSAPSKIVLLIWFAVQPQSVISVCVLPVHMLVLCRWKTSSWCFPKISGHFPRCFNWNLHAFSILMFKSHL